MAFDRPRQGGPGQKLVHCGAWHHSITVTSRRPRSFLSLRAKRSNLHTATAMEIAAPLRS